jgi:DNA-binding XRE family transcriptional regulator
MTNADQHEPSALPWEAAFASHLKRARERLQMSQTELARQAAEQGLPYHQQTVQRVETLARPIRLNEALVLAGIVGEDLTTMLATPTPATAKAHLRYREHGAAKLRTEVLQWLRDTGDRAERGLSELLDAVSLYDEVVPGGVTPKVRGGVMWHERSLRRIAAGCRALREDLDGPEVVEVPSRG